MARTVATKARAPAADDERPPHGNFVVARIPREFRPGQSLAILQFAETEAAALKWIEELEDTTAGFIAVLEVKGRYERKPKMVITKLERE